MVLITKLFLDLYVAKFLISQQNRCIRVDKINIIMWSFRIS